MHKKASLLFGLTLIALAILALAATLLGDLKVIPPIRTGLNTWPLFVIGAGLLFCIPPFLFRKQIGLGGLFIPGLPVLITGILLFISSVTGDWGLWAGWWPLEIVGLALGFMFAAIFLRVVWLMLPSSIVGLTGLVLLFCALTHQWAAWAILWTVVPFSVGLPLLLIGLFRKIDGVKLAGIILCGFAGLAFAAMSAFIPSSSTIIRLIGPVIILALGVFLIATALFKKPEKPVLSTKEE